ncbi:MAG: TIGR03032 family protein [Methylococcales bacterium]|nr:TIGR03032 family protein [Methylococcales bacterium]
MTENQTGATIASTPAKSPAVAAPFVMQDSEKLVEWLSHENISLAFTTYQTNRLFLVGRGEPGHIAVNERLFDKPMGLYAKGSSLYMATRYQLWQLDNRLAPNEQYQGYDRLYVPTQAHTTGDLNVHDVVLDAKQRILFINTDYSCLATLEPGYSFVPLWKPPFISKLVAEDRCHLNGLALQRGEPTYVTACSATDAAAGWRNHRHNGGIVIHIPSNEIIATGLSMPHSPRYYQGKLWLLNSGSGEFGYLDGEKFIPITFCPGFVRGLAFWKNYALVGLSKLRATSFGGLAIEKPLQTLQQSARCGLVIIDLNTGSIVHWLHIDGVVEELFDVVILPEVRKPSAFGFQNNDIERCVNFPGSAGIKITKPSVPRKDIAATIPIAGLPPQEASTATADTPIKYQQVFHLTPQNLAPYAAMIQPRLQQRWHRQPLRGELLGISASVEGEMIGLTLAERWQEQQHTMVELLSCHVVPSYQHLPVAAQLTKYLQRAIAQ